jgi:putative glutathione S-transferase
MSLMVRGELQEDWLESELEDGEFVRQDSQFRHWITPDGAPGHSGEGGFPAEAGRYHLYVSYACPWAHRTLIFRQLKGLGDWIGVSVVHPHMGPSGWDFRPFPGAEGDRLYGHTHLHQLYTRAQADYTGIVTVPVLWDRKRETIVNNESSEIIRMFNSAFDPLGARPGNYYPAELRSEIDSLNQRIYDTVNNGVYRAGFATNQAAYEEAVVALFGTLDILEARLSTRRYLLGQRITEADWRLFPTLLRFDPVYYSHFKCNLRRIADYPNLSSYLRDLYQQPGIAETVFMDHIKQHYYWSHEQLNPHRIVPLGPKLDLAAPHDRGRFEGQ